MQSLGGGVWSLAMLALEHLGLEPNRDKILVVVLGDQDEVPVGSVNDPAEKHHIQARRSSTQE